MKSSSKQVLVVGDRVLIQPHKGDKMSPAGLYLPPSVVEKQDVRDGIVVEVGPGNVPPVIAQGEQLFGSIYEDNASSWTPPDLNASNSDGDTLVWSLLPGQGPSHGTATVDGNGSKPTTFDYVSDANYSGLDSFVIRLSDGYAEINATVNVTVHPVNDSPKLYGTPVLSAVEGKLYSFDLNATDIDGDALTFTFADSPSWLAFQDLNQGLVRISGIPPIGSRGDSKVTFIAMDEGNATFEMSFDLVVSDGLPPVLTLLGDSLLQLPQGEAFIEPGYIGSDDSDGESLKGRLKRVPVTLSPDGSDGECSVDAEDVGLDAGTFTMLLLL
mgnify:CR=1 FL=1